MYYNHIHGMAGHEGEDMSKDRIILRQSWLGQLAMCPERARQDMLGISESTDSTSSVLGSAVHYGIEQCLLDKMQTGDPLTKGETVAASMEYWTKHVKDIVRWNHKEGEPEKIIIANTEVWWDEVLPDVHPIAVEKKFELPLVVDHQPEIWLQGTIDCICFTWIVLIAFKWICEYIFIY